MGVFWGREGKARNKWIIESVLDFKKKNNKLVFLDMLEISQVFNMILF